MSANTTLSKALSVECISLLDAHEVSAVPLPITGNSVFALNDVDGNFMFRVTGSIDARDLQTMLLLYKHRFDAGHRAGREESFASLRELIGVTSAIEKATGDRL